MHFLFPSDPLSDGRCDEMFEEQRVALQAAGFATSLIPDAVFDGGGRLRGVNEGAMVVYRGWMVTPSQYDALEAAVTGAGAALLTRGEQYRFTHYLPNWYPLVADLTPETHVFDVDEDLVSGLRRLGWPRFFVKDYVKSLKTSTGAIIDSPKAITTLLEEMARFRGEIEGGVCVRRVEEFLPETERRYFVIQGRPHASVEGAAMPNIVEEVARRIGSPFFSVDVTRRRDGEMRVVEIGDGQVSDLVGWSPESFAEVWRKSSPD
jgi:hypothetical protein